VKVIDKIRQFNDWEMAQFLTEYTKVQIQRAVDSVNNKFGADLVTIEVSMDVCKIREYLNEEVNECEQ
jgi:hypothetical protein